MHGHTILQEKRAVGIYDEVGQRSLERLFPGFTEDSLVRATLSAGHFGIGYTRARDIAAPAQLGALMAARPRIQAVIQDAVTAGLLLKRPLEARLDVVIETATSTYLETLDDEDRVQKAAQAADEAWQQTIDAYTGPSVTNPTVSELEHPSFPLLKMKTVMICIFLRAFGQVARIEDLCHTHVPHKWPTTHTHVREVS